MTTTAQDARSAGSAGLKRLARIVWRRKLVALSVAVLVLVGVGLYLATTTRMYTAAAKVATAPADTTAQTSPDTEALLGTVAEIAESRPVLETVHTEIPSRSITELHREVTGAVVFDTLIVQVTVEDRDPDVAAQIANAVAAELPKHDPSLGTVEYQTVEPATPPEHFSSPDLQVAGLAGVFLALALGCAAAVGYDKLRQTVDTPEDAGELSDTRMLGAVPRPTDPTGLCHDDIDTREFASLRAMRVALEFASSEDPTRTLVVAPVAEDPWGGWLEVNLAAVLAEVGHRVLLIDADRGDGKRHPVLDAPGAPGLYDVLAGSKALAEVTGAGPVPGVDVVSIGSADLASPSLLEMRFRSLVDDVDDEYDVILVHAAGVTQSDDARIVAIDGGLLLTVQAGRVRPHLLQKAAADLRAVRTRVLGTAVVGV